MPTQITFQPAGSQLVARKGLERVADVDPRLTRSHYFDNRLLTAEDLNRDQTYLDGRLREVGRALGYGVLRGLELSLDTFEGEITVAPGIAISAAGRVLELTQPLTLNLNDKARISELNGGSYRRFNRALYGVILSYVEIGTDIAEVFPTDLGDKKTVQYDVMSEGVQMAMVPLHLPLMQQNPLHIRAHLMQQLYRDNTAAGAIPEDAVALGVLAIANDRPQWLDAELLRQPLRALASEGDWQSDLYRRYQKLFKDVMAERQSGSLTGDFAAGDYFRWLPPVGSLPKASIDPVNGRQGFFPEHYQVWVAPVRLAELELIRQESMVLPPFDLNLNEPMDVVVLAPLKSADYGNLAARLERPANAGSGKPAGLDLLRLRLYPKQPVHQLDLDSNTWQAIWDIVQEEDLLFVRRPLRAAETQMSGIVLNTPPAPPPVINPNPSPADENLLADEGSVFLNRVNIAYLAERRGSDSAESSAAVVALQADFGDNALVTQNLMNLLLRIERVYDALLWPTLLGLAQNDGLAAFYSELVTRQDAGESTPEAIVATGAGFGLDGALVAQWATLLNSD